MKRISFFLIAALSVCSALSADLQGEVVSEEEFFLSPVEFFLGEVDEQTASLDPAPAQNAPIETDSDLVQLTEEISILPEDLSQVEEIAEEIEEQAELEIAPSDEIEEEIVYKEAPTDEVTTSKQQHADWKKLALPETAPATPASAPEPFKIEEPVLVAKNQNEAVIDLPVEAKKLPFGKIQINLIQVFAGAPIIYSLLLLLSIAAISIWLYGMWTIRSSEFLPKSLIKDLRTKLLSNQFSDALDLCTKEKHFFCKILASAILTRKHGMNMMFEAMKAEGKRTTVSFWQRINLLNDIAIVAPMLGLLGTVIGMFYAFYDLNRSIESMTLLFDGFGISAGTTVAGLIVAIISMTLHSILKYRLVRVVAQLENEAQTFAALIDTSGSKYSGN